MHEDMTIKVGDKISVEINKSDGEVGIGIRHWLRNRKNARIISLLSNIVSV